MITETTPSTESITLYYREGASDKVYQASIEPAGSGFVVNFAYGRRGSTLNTGTKTIEPVTYDAAKTIHAKLVREKTAKGYTPGESGTPYVGTSSESRTSGILPQLLNPIDETEAITLLRDHTHCLQEKFDGRRVLIRKRNGDIEGINRKGFTIALPLSIVAAASQFRGDYILDGECVGETFHAFDLLESEGQDWRGDPYVRRLAELDLLLSPAGATGIVKVLTGIPPEQKQEMFGHLLRAKREGIVFKDLDATYTAGRPNSGGPQLKYKFYATLSAVVKTVNTQRSVELKLLGTKGWVPCGNVTIPPDRPIPQPGSVVEARYLYAFAESGSLYQPTYLAQRSDVDPGECTTSQLKFKSEEEPA